MNTLDFEKTQIWAKNLMNAPMPPIPDVPVQAPMAAAAAIPAMKPPVLKKMSKEEKLILAAGGALAIGLGAIVLVNLSDEELAEVKPVAPANLKAPVLDLGMASPPPVVPEEEEKPEPTPKPHHAPRHEPVVRKETQPPVHHESVVKPEIDHALLEIPEKPEVATQVGDNLTFIEAFNAARLEVGPGGIFAWRDTYYSTFTDKEWEAVPEDKQAKWLDAAEPIIDPGYENLSEVAAQQVPDDVQHVVVAERGEITWTGIDKNGDGQAEILMARINGQSPMVLLDTDGDGILDKRYDYQADSGKTFASDIEPFSMSVADIEHLEYIPVEPDMGFYNHSGNATVSENLPVSIYNEGSQYVVSLDSNGDHTVDAVTYLTDDRGPVVGLDFDNDGKIEMGYVYDADQQSINSLEMEPMDEMSAGTELPSFTYEATDAELDAYNTDLAYEISDDPDDYFGETNEHEHRDDDALS